MAVDAFLKIEGIEGESIDKTHPGSIEVESFSWGLSQSGSAATGGGGGAGKVQFQDFHFVSNTSKASPSLMLACASGKHITKVQLFCRKAGDNRGAGLEFIKLKFEDCLISGYQAAGSSGSEPMDQVSFNFAKIEFMFIPQKADGTADTPVTTGWDVKANKKV